MIDYERVELPRTEFRPTKVRFSPVTGKRELYYPLYWKVLRMFASFVAMIIAVLIVIGSVVCLMIFKSWCGLHLGGPYATIVATAMLNLIIIIILGEIWCRLAEWLTDKENHKYTDSLIIKRYLFDFANMHATLLYYAFFKAPNLFIKYLHATKDEELLAAQLEFILVFEHVVFLFKIILRAAIPNVPLTIKLAVQRSKYMSRVANEDLDSEMDSEYYGYEDTDSLSQSDDTSESEGEDDGSVSRAGSTTRHPSEQTNLGTGTTTAAVGEDGGDGDQGFKKTDRPGFGLPRLWSNRGFHFGGSTKRKKKSRIPRGCRDTTKTLSAAMAGALPKILEIPPSIRSASVAGTNEKVFSGAATANGYGVGYLPQQQQQEEREQEEMMQHRSPLSQSPIVGIDRLLHPRQSLGSQRRPIPQRANTDMDGDWVVLEEKGM
ncbi:hypothetical protein BGX23_000879 [Mortierella sp. AD031]|nr:hypothetical protein BGX23_000879 [Mortierella sp. AD031]